MNGATLGLAGACGMLAAACAGREVEPPPPPRAERAPVVFEMRDEGADGPFAPASLRVHPLTGFVRGDADGDLALEVHIELTDAWGHVVKGVGRVTLELYDGRGGATSQLERWVIDLLDAEISSRPFDRVTRTYRFTLVGVPGSALDGGSLILAARFETVGGRELTATHRFGDQAR